MSFKSKFADWRAAERKSAKSLDPAAIDPAFKEALADFRLSVHAWSDAAYARPLELNAVAHRRKAWRLAAAWTLGLVLMAGGISGGIYEHQHRQELARIAAAEQAARQKALAEAQAREEEELLAKVDRDVSREVPSAMEPLTVLMSLDDTQ